MKDNKNIAGSNERERLFHLILNNEPLRKEMLFAAIKKVVITITIFLAIVICVLNCITYDNSIFIPISLLGLAILFVSIEELKRADKNFKYILKEKYMSSMTKIFEGFKWQRYKHVLSDEFIRDSKLFGNFDNCKIDDSFRGKYKGVKFKIQEIHLQIGGEGDSDGIYTIFKGILLSFNYNKSIKTDLVVSLNMDKSTQNKFQLYMPLLYFTLFLIPGIVELTVNDFNFGFNFGTIYTFPILISMCIFIITRLISNHVKTRKLHKIELEDIGFAKKYTVHSGDEIEARYLLTSSFMERLKNLTTSFGTDKIKCSFISNQINFAIPTNKDLFEFVSLFRPLSDSRTVEKFYKQLSSIQDMITYFKFDEKIGL